MRVLQCIDTLGGGGAERQLIYLVEGLVRLGLEVDVVYLLEGTHAARLAASGATLHPLGWRTPLPLVADLCRIIRRRDVDVVQTWLGRMGAAGGMAGQLTRRPWLYCERSVGGERGWRAWLRRLLATGAAAVVANSHAGAAAWRDRAGARVHVVPNGVELEAIVAAPTASRAALGLADDAELIVYAGRFVAPKNIPVLAAALAGVLVARPRAVALVCGDGVELPAFRAAVDGAGVGPRCHTRGYRDDLWSLIKAADLLFAPSLHEGRPNVVLEAMACRCPLVLSEIAAHRECVPRAAALWFDPARAADAVAVLGRCLDDRASARGRADIAFQAVRDQSVDEMARAYARLYQRLLAPDGGSAPRA